MRRLGNSQRRSWLHALASLLVTGCAADLNDIGQAPRMTPVGSGLGSHVNLVSRDALPTRSASNSMWSDRNSNLYRDQKARAEGDILTINVSINDRAQIGNSSDRTRESKVKGSLNYAAQLIGLDALGAAAADLGSVSSTKGEGAINRSERIQLSLAAIVASMLPNGNLYVRGTQEIRVNYELRVLEIAGIVRQNDITRDNTISYDKIAEARVSYGGRGRLMEVQQPNTIHQIYDLVKPL